MMGGGSDDLFNEMSSKWWAVGDVKCPMGGGSDDLFNEMSSKWAVVVTTVFNEMQ